MAYSTKDYHLERIKKEGRDLTITIALAFAVPVLIFCGYLFTCFMEARTYSKLTGNSVSTWDAIWVDLRVQDEPQ